MIQPGMANTNSISPDPVLASDASMRQCVNGWERIVTEDVIDTTAWLSA